MKSSLFLDIMQRGFVVICLCFGTAYRAIFKSQAIFLDCLSLEDGRVGYPETSVRNYKSTLRNVVEE
jgi:hypothetical protein